MIFNSIQFLIFLPIVTLIYYIIPEKLKTIWLLMVSYYFYMCWNVKYIFLILLSTIITYVSGILIHKAKKVHSEISKFIVVISIVSNLGILIFFKYINWILQNIGEIFQLHIVSTFSFLLPVGISFYTFQALSYVIDVYKGDVEAEKNFIEYALFISFFPQLVAGPIERSGRLLHQINEIGQQKIDFGKIRYGFCLMLYGFFLKVVIADRVAILVDTAFQNYMNYGFVELLIAVVLFAVQILCDFNGYTIIARGSAQLLGIDLSNNFQQPYLSESINDFWHRWHISLTSWFTDYLYIPLGGNRRGTFRKKINVMIVFGISGLWHGASWHYVVWGVLHGLYQNIWGGTRDKKNKRIQWIGIFLTFIITDFAWIFFRAPSCMDAILYIKQMIMVFQRGSLLGMGLFWYDWFILVTSLIAMIVVDMLHECGISIKEWFFSKGIIVRWVVYLGFFWWVLLFGVYGAEYDASQFIYFQF